MAYGFGGIPKYMDGADEESDLLNCFPLNGKIENPAIGGL